MTRFDSHMSRSGLLVHTSALNYPLPALSVLEQSAKSFSDISSLTLRSRDLTDFSPAPHRKPSTFPELVIEQLENECRASPNDSIRKAIPSDFCEWVSEFWACRRWTVAAWRGVFPLPKPPRINRLCIVTSYHLRMQCQS